MLRRTHFPTEHINESTIPVRETHFFGPVTPAEDPPSAGWRFSTSKLHFLFFPPFYYSLCLNNLLLVICEESLILLTLTRSSALPFIVLNR